MKKALRAVALFAFALPASGALGETLGLDHKASACTSTAGQLVLEASLPATSQVASLRVYFRGSAEGEEYFLEMREAAPGRFLAVLPRPAAGVEAITYRFVARNIASAESSSSSYSVPVEATCPSAALSDAQRRYADNLVLGRSSKEGPVVGFECEGIIAQVAASGDLDAASCGEAIEASTETGPATATSAARSGVARVAVTDRARRVVSRSRP
jgi:hypothetical protein